LFIAKVKFTDYSKLLAITNKLIAQFLNLIKIVLQKLPYFASKGTKNKPFIGRNNFREFRAFTKQELSLERKGAGSILENRAVEKVFTLQFRPLC
jgi:hypothetical protein